MTNIVKAGVLLGCKILYCASTASHIKNFHLPYIKAFLNRGCEVYTATGDAATIDGAKAHFCLPLHKSFFSFKNIKAIFSARRLLQVQRFDAICLHTTLAAAVLRAAIFTLPKRQRPKVFYTCHGYLFGENDGAAKWCYLLPEKLCAGVTDVLMVMNREDEAIARKYNLCAGPVYYINGMGLDACRCSMPAAERHLAAKQALGFSSEQFLFVYAAEFSKRKNHRQLIEAFAQVCDKMPHTHLLLAGSGTEFNSCRQLAEQLGASGQIHFLGYVIDIPALLDGCDACVSTSLIEGLPFNVMEARASGLRVLASNIKGHRELSGTGAFELFETTTQLASLMTLASQTPNRRYAAELAPFLLKNVLPAIMQIYQNKSTGVLFSTLTKAGDL